MCNTAARSIRLKSHQAKKIASYARCVHNAPGTPVRTVLYVRFETVVQAMCARWNAMDWRCDELCLLKAAIAVERCWNASLTSCTGRTETAESLLHVIAHYMFMLWSFGFCNTCGLPLSPLDSLCTYSCILPITAYHKLSRNLLTVMRGRSCRLPRSLLSAIFI
jgi:hypothetical protein